MAKFQLCQFRRSANSDWEKGIAKLNSDFGCHDINSIIDANGNMIGNQLFDYKLLFGFSGCVIDTDQQTFGL